MSIAAIIVEGVGPGSAASDIIVFGFLFGSVSPPITPPTPPVPPSPPSVQTVFPHDDYWDENLRPWWQWPSKKDRDAHLTKLRQEAGLIPLPPEAEEAVEQAAKAIIAEPEIARSENKAVDLVKPFEREYRNAIKDALADARMSASFEAHFRDAYRELLGDLSWWNRVKAKIAEEEDEMLVIAAAWFMH